MSTPTTSAGPVEWFQDLPFFSRLQQHAGYTFTLSFEGIDKSREDLVKKRLAGRVKSMSTGYNFLHKITAVTFTIY